MKTYKAEFEDENIEIFTATSNKKATEKAFKFESEHGTLFNIFLLDNDYNKIKTIF